MEPREIADILESIQTNKHNPIINLDVGIQISKMNLKTFFDVGAGDGYYGKLVQKMHPHVMMTAIEKRNAYIKQWSLEDIYDEVICDDIVNVIDSLRGDFICFGDVLEHIERSQALQILDIVVPKFKYIMVNGPVGYQPQPHAFEEEIHRGGLERADFNKYRVQEYHEYLSAMFNCLIFGPTAPLYNKIREHLKLETENAKEKRPRSKT